VRTKDRRQLGRPSWFWLAVGGTGIIGLIVALVLVFAARDNGGGTDQTVNQALLAAGCTVQNKKPPAFTSDHSLVPTLNTNMKKHWNTFPPAAGAHYGRFAVWGFYREPINPRQVVHNEEHGGTVLWWGPQTPKATVDRLYEFYLEEPVSMFGTPIAGLGSKVAITSWSGSPNTYFQNGNYGIGHVGVCATFDDEVVAAFRKFRDAYRGRGPELPYGTALQANQPGAGAS
jgi:hypothetical protein